MDKNISVKYTAWDLKDGDEVGCTEVAWNNSLDRWVICITILNGPEIWEEDADLMVTILCQAREKCIVLNRVEQQNRAMRKTLKTEDERHDTTGD